MPPPEWTPTSADVAAEIRARVKDANGNELEDFSDETRPTDEQVDLLIPKAVADVEAKIGSLESCTAENIEDLRAAANSLAAIRAAMRVERTYFPEQIGSDRSAYSAMSAEYTDGIKTLIEAVAESCGGGGGDSVGGGSGVKPSSSFPEHELISYDSAW